MKTVIITLLLLLVSLSAHAQDKITIKLKNTRSQPLRNVQVTANNSAAGDVVTGTTDANGRVTLVLSKIGVYSFSYLNEKDFDTYEVKEGLTGTFSRTVTHDPKGVFDKKPTGDRSGIQFAEVSNYKFKGKPNAMTLTIRVATTKRAPVVGAQVTLVSIADKFKMKGRSNGRGDVIFHVKANSDFEVDVDGNESLKVLTTPDLVGGNSTQYVFYEKLKITEIAKGDTLIQRNITQTNGTNTHRLFSLKLLNYDGIPLEGEPVYLQQENGTRVYESVTNKKGECNLMIQKNADYILNLKYEQGLHLVEAKNTQGFGRESLTRRYRGSAEIERIIAEQEAEMRRMREREEARQRELKLAAMAASERRIAKKKMEKELVMNFYDEKLVPTFNPTPVRAAAAPSNYIKKTTEGYTVQFNSSGPIGTPTVIDDNIFVPAGYYSPNFYCLNAATGSYKWGVELGESGASPAVYSNGVILINTYSCTLYALDSKTGRLLWSKWLAGTVYSTPTADGNKVYVVFRYGGAYVLSCFDLRTGDFLWINRVDSETIACPVVEGNEVHVASQSGFYYIFNKDTGKPIEVITSIDAVSSPTIMDKSIFLTATVDGKDRLVEIDRTTNKVKKSYKTELKPIRISGGGQRQMNFNGTHPIVYKNKFVVLVDRDGIKVFDAQSERILWQKSVMIENSQ
ncbi:MAG: PQQ-binding-like beta-propeller repeat protein, partial [Crocinitomicaceae bacterium]